MIKPSAALIRAIEASRQSRRMSPRTRWLVEHHEAISTAETTPIRDWRPLCDLAATEGAVEGNGQPPTPKRMARLGMRYNRRPRLRSRGIRSSSLLRGTRPALSAGHLPRLLRDRRRQCMVPRLKKSLTVEFQVNREQRRKPGPGWTVCCASSKSGVGSGLAVRRVTAADRLAPCAPPDAKLTA